MFNLFTFSEQLLLRIEQLLLYAITGLRSLRLWAKLAGCILFVSAIAALGLWTFGLTTRIKTTNTSTHEGAWDNLWLTLGGEVIASRTEQVSDDNGNSAFGQIIIWRSGHGTTTLDLRDWYRNVSAEIYKKLPDAQRTPREIDRPTPPSEWYASPYAVRRDGSGVAKYYKGYLLIGNLTDPPEVILLEPQVTSTSTPQSAANSRLVFTEDGRLAILQGDGKIELRSQDGRYIVGTAKTTTMVPARLLVSGKYLLATSSTDESFATFDLDSFNGDVKSQRESILPPSQHLIPAMSGDGSVAVVDNNFNVLISKVREGNAEIKLSSPVPINALAFYDNDKVVVGGSFPNLYLLSQAEGPKLFTDAPRDVNHIVVNSKQIVFDTGGYDSSGMTFLVSYEERRVLNTAGKIILAAWPILLLISLPILYYQSRIKKNSEIIIEKAVTKSPEPSPTIRDLPKELVQACASGNCALYAGAGLSAQAGLVTWETFVYSLLVWAKEKGFTEGVDVESFRAAIDAGDADKVADGIVSAVKSNNSLPMLHDYLREVFLRPTPLPEAYALLREIKFSAVLTTNFDDLLERGYAKDSMRVYTPQNTKELLDALTKRESFILKLYGTLDRPDTVMVAPAQYEDAVSGNREFSQFMETLFRSRTLLFIGASLEGIEAYLKGITLPRDISTKHWALVAATDNVWQAKADFLERRYGIKVLSYSPSGDFREVNEFLRNLAEEVATRAETAHVSSHEAARLKHLSLKNIGPFDQLEIDFNSHWNILLGDNGVGKSSILKAIGIALCGERAQPYAGRIIKSGETEASIVLRTDRDTVYETKLVLKDDEAEVITETARPLVAEGWLAIGFPPLRTTSWERPKPDTETPGKSRSTPEDVLPIVKGDLDPRLDKLKQWLISVDYQRSRSEEEGKGAGARYEKLIADLFDVINKMSHPLTITYQGVDKHTRKIQVETESDGAIPIEAMSQGIISLISWVGVLMQRFYEVYDKEAEPRKAYALVLMDEIDAHMHPAWQQALVHHLKDTFPNAQFLATTHSPLIVGGMPADQLRRFYRDKAGKVRSITVDPDMTVGRADQILTGDLFSLETTLDVTTQEKIEEYQNLLEKQARTESEGRELDDVDKKNLLELQDLIGFRIPKTGETPPERQAQELLEALLEQHVGGKYPAVKERVLEEAAKLLKVIQSRQEMKR